MCRKGAPTHLTASFYEWIRINGGTTTIVARLASPSAAPDYTQRRTPGGNVVAEGLYDALEPRSRSPRNLLK